MKNKNNDEETKNWLIPAEDNLQTEFMIAFTC